MLLHRPLKPVSFWRFIVNKLILTALSLSILTTTAFAQGGDNARANWERSRTDKALQVQSQIITSQTQISREARAEYEAQVIKANRANYHGR